jgi:predicted MPP superfamily phosphohydrolase
MRITMSFIEKLIVAMIVGDVVCWGYAHWVPAWLPDRRVWRTAIDVFFAMQVAGLGLVILSRSAHGQLDILMAKPILSAVFIWHCLLLPPLLLIRLAGLATRSIVGFARLCGFPRRVMAPRNAGGISRRDFFATAFAAAPAAICLGATAVALPQLERFRVRRLTVPLAQLPPELDGMTIAHVSDLHVGRFTHGKVLDEVVRVTNELDADLVLLTGDLINFELHDLPPALELVKAMRGRNGVIMCEGNHDLIEDPHAFETATKASGVPLLINESVVLPIRGHPVQLLGLRWGSPSMADSRAAQHGDDAIAASLRELIGQRRSDAFPILLAHHPHAFDFAEELPLTLSGHTHGGQLMLNQRTGFGPALFRYWSGLYRHGERALVVSNGVGNWFPLRTRAPAEIVHLTLTTPVTRPTAREGF